MEEKIKEIVAVFIKIPAGQINPATAVDRTAVNSSILLHRMYAKLAEQGVSVENYTEIRSFADLMNRIKDGSIAGGPAPVSGPGEDSIFSSGNGLNGSGPGIGIDIEEVASMPQVNDYRRDAFYQMNFTPGEIAYCILQTDPPASFAGLFAAKEAIVKADNNYRQTAFNVLPIHHTQEGKPFHPEFLLSVSHAGGFATAVAIPAGNFISGPQRQQQPVLPVRSAKRESAALFMSFTALVISVIILLIILFHK